MKRTMSPRITITAITRRWAYTFTYQPP